jgi:hypothetical protein
VLQEIMDILHIQPINGITTGTVGLPIEEDRYGGTIKSSYIPSSSDWASSARSR